MCWFRGRCTGPETCTASEVYARAGLACVARSKSRYGAGVSAALTEIDYRRRQLNLHFERASIHLRSRRRQP